MRGVISNLVHTVFKSEPQSDDNKPLSKNKLEEACMYQLVPATKEDTASYNLGEDKWLGLWRLGLPWHRDK